MLWKSAVPVPDTEGNHYAIVCLTEMGELWCFLPKRDLWYRVRRPNELEIARQEDANADQS